MTEPTTAIAIRADLTANALALGQARADEALYERLTAAKATIDRLVKQGNDLTGKLAKALEKDAKAARDTLFAGLSDLKITETVNERASGLLNNRFIVTYDRPVWDGHDSVPTTITIKGFGALEPRVYSWIVERHPDKIPASILALVPGDPRDALDSYMAALARGHLKSVATPY